MVISEWSDTKRVNPTITLVMVWPESPGTVLGQRAHVEYSRERAGAGAEVTPRQLEFTGQGAEEESRKERTPRISRSPSVLRQVGVRKASEGAKGRLDGALFTLSEVGTFPVTITIKSRSFCLLVQQILLQAKCCSSLQKKLTARPNRAKLFPAIFTASKGKV